MPGLEPQNRAGSVVKLISVLRFFSVLLLAAAIGLWILSGRIGTAPPEGDPIEAGRPSDPIFSPARFSFEVIPDVEPVEVSFPEEIPWWGEAALSEVVVGMPEDSCVVVRSAGETIFSHKADAALIPASLQKLVTVQGVLQAAGVYPQRELELGPDFVYQTLAFSESPPVQGVIGGDLYLLGGGDPLLSTPEYAELLAAEDAPASNLDNLAQQIVDDWELRRIEGSVVTVDLRYDSASSVSTWPEGFAETGVTGTLSSAALNQGYDFSPEFGSLDGLRPDPEAALRTAVLFDDMLEARDVAIPFRPEVAPRDRQYSESTTSLGILNSAPLRDYMSHMLKESDNTTSELLLKEIGLHLTGTDDDGNASTLDGAIAVQDILRQKLVNLTRTPADGSGLSPDNRLSCSQATALLEMEPYGGPEGELASYLPVSGVSGTLEDRFTSDKIRGRVRAKTGSLSQATTLAGFAEGIDGTWFTFAVILNHDGFLTDAVTEPILESLLDILVSSDAVD